MTLQALVSNNYDDLKTVAKRITGRKDYMMASDLISETYVSVYEKKKQPPTDKLEFIKWFSKCMKNQFVWRGTGIKKLYNSKENLIIDTMSAVMNAVAEEDSGNIGKWKAMEDPDALNDIELYVEETNEVTLELINISSSLGKKKTLRYIELIEFKRTLPDYEKYLFELYFEKGFSTREIAAMYSNAQHKMNYQSVNSMINIIKKKINERKWKQ